MELYEELLNGNAKLSLIGLGYVGMPIAVAFSKKIDVIGFDNNADKIALYQQGVDPTQEVGDEVIKHCNVKFTADERCLQEAKFHIREEYQSTLLLGHVRSCQPIRRCVTSWLR